jgi:hypothetical protein
MDERVGSRFQIERVPSLVYAEDRAFVVEETTRRPVSRRQRYGRWAVVPVSRLVGVHSATGLRLAPLYREMYSAPNKVHRQS